MQELVHHIDWVGTVDWNVRDFHGYDTYRGATYNAYLVRDDQTALIDTVKVPFADHLLRNISEKTELSKVDYVVCNHAELDHAGALPIVLQALPNATLLCNAKCRETLAAHFDLADWKIRVVSPDEKISLGHRTLSFMNTPMVHWPESMFTYIPEEKLLFSMDAFGQHLATAVRFDDQWDLPHILMEAKSYYANIVTPYGKQVQKTLEAAAGLPMAMIAPSHGLIWRKHLPTILAAYQNWSSGQYAPKALILYDTMWESTARMAEAIFHGAMAENAAVDVQLLHVRKTTLTRIATEMLDAAAVALGSPTLNMMMMPQLAAVLSYVRGLKFTAKSAFAFGSCGWAHAGVDQLVRFIEELQWTVVHEPIKTKFRPSDAVLKTCRDAGRLLAQRAASVKSGKDSAVHRH